MTQYSNRELEKMVHSLEHELAKLTIENQRLRDDFSKMSNDDIEKSNELDLKEMAHWYGGWNELRKVIDRLEDNENEAAWERSQERLIEDGGYSASEESERMYKIQRDLK